METRNLSLSKTAIPTNSTCRVKHFGPSLSILDSRRFITNKRTRFCPVAAIVDDIGVKVEDSKNEFRPFNYNKTYYPKKIDTDGIAKPWYIVDAEGQILGRLASLVAMMIRGKLNPAYTPSMDMGAFVVVINAEKVTVSGRKYTNKIYYRHTVGRPGKAKRESFRDLQKRIPERILENAIKGMLPKGRLGHRLIHHLKIYQGDSHPHEAQKPKDITALINAKASDYPSVFAESS